MCVCVCVCVCVGQVGDGESAMAVKSLGTGPVAELGGDVGVWRGVRWKVVGCSGSREPEVVTRGNRKEVNRSAFFFRCVCFAAFGMGWEAMASPSTFGVRA